MPLSPLSSACHPPLKLLFHPNSFPLVAARKEMDSSNHIAASEPTLWLSAMEGRSGGSPETGLEHESSPDFHGAEEVGRMTNGVFSPTVSFQLVPFTFSPVFLSSFVFRLPRVSFLSSLSSPLLSSSLSLLLPVDRHWPSEISPLRTPHRESCVHAEQTRAQEGRPRHHRRACCYSKKRADERGAEAWAD